MALELDDRKKRVEAANWTVEDEAAYLAMKAAIRQMERRRGTAVAVKCPRCGHRHQMQYQFQEVKE